MDNVANIHMIDHVKIEREKPDYKQFHDFMHQTNDAIILYNPDGEKERTKDSLADTFVKKYEEFGHESKVKEVIHNIPEF